MFAGVYQKQVFSCCGGLPEILMFQCVEWYRMLFSSGSWRKVTAENLSYGVYLEHFGVCNHLEFMCQKSEFAFSLICRLNFPFWVKQLKIIGHKTKCDLSSNKLISSYSSFFFFSFFLDVQISPKGQVRESEYNKNKYAEKKFSWLFMLGLTLSYNDIFANPLFYNKMKLLLPLYSYFMFIKAENSFLKKALSNILHLLIHKFFVVRYISEM